MTGKSELGCKATIVERSSFSGVISDALTPNLSGVRGQHDVVCSFDVLLGQRISSHVNGHYSGGKAMEVDHFPETRIGSRLQFGFPVEDDTVGNTDFRLNCFRSTRTVIKSPM